MPRSRGFVTTRQRRATMWVVGPQTGVDGATIQIDTSTSVLAAGGSVAVLDGLTIVRT